MRSNKFKLGYRDTYEKIVFGISKDHVNRLVLKHDLSQGDDIHIIDFPIQLYNQSMLRFQIALSR